MSKEAFGAVKSVLVAQSEGMLVTKDGPSAYELHIAGPIELAGRNLPDLFFAAVREGKHDTALHFFPIYSHPQRFADLPATLRKKMTGKSCFHIKAVDEELLDAVAAMLARGRAIYSDQAQTLERGR
jgi:hypothetical protein